MAHQRIDGRALAEVAYVDPAIAPHLPSALWFPADIEDEPALLDVLLEAWSGYTWGTVDQRVGRGPNLPPPGPERDGVVALAEATFTTPAGRAHRTQWITVDGASPTLRAEAERVRSSRKPLVVLRESALLSDWHDATFAMAHRSLRGGTSPRRHQTLDLDEYSSVAYLTAAATNGFAAFLPLDIHPWAGCAVVSDDGFLDELESALPQILPGVARNVSPDEVVRRAGSLRL